jgi:hypothetical protein
MQSEAEFFRAHVPVAFRRRLLTVVFDGCGAAFRQARARDEDFFVDAVPQLRRLEVEPALSKLILPRGWVSEVIRTPSTNYTQLSSDKVVITAVTRADEVTYVEPYRYRATLARSRQIVMSFVEGVRPEPQVGDKLYALLVYGGPHKAPLPSIARIVFPDENGSIQTDDVNLMLDHDDVCRRYRDTQKRTAANVDPVLRKKPGSQEA